MAVPELLDAPQALGLRLKQAGHPVARAGVRVITDAPPPVRRRSSRGNSVTPTPLDDPAAPPVRQGRSALQHPADEAIAAELWGGPQPRPNLVRDPAQAVDAWLEERPIEAPVDGWFDQIDDTLEPALERTMAHESHEPKRWSVPEDVPTAVLVVPIVLGITIISTVVGMIILF